MSQSIIRVLYETRLSAWAKARGLAVAYENVDLTPPEDKAYLQAFMLPGNTSSNDLQGVHRAYVGVFQITVQGLKSGGAKAAQDIAEGLATHFSMNQRLTSDTFVVQQVSPASLGPARADEKRYAISVSFSYRADTIS
jgi:hypothetical protein